MDKFIIQGPTALNGEISVSGSKNAALPLMAAAMLGNGTSVIRNLPRLKDILTFNNVIRVTGTRVDHDVENATLHINPDNATYFEAPYELVRKMRASFYMLGALLGKFGYARVSLPGGCAWGPRPVDLHIEALKAIGAEITMDKGYVIAKAPENGLPGGEYTFNPSSVGATVNALLGSVLANGTSVFHNVAREPDVIQLCNTLTSMGAKIKGVGTSTLTVHGVKYLEPMDATNDPDRIEAGTYMLAAIMHPDSDVTLTNCNPDQLGHFLEMFDQTGAEVEVNRDAQTIRVKAPQVIHPVSITTDVYPGFPTDLQAQWATVMTQANGTSVITDTVYTDRFSYVPELKRLGADLHIQKNSVHVKGKTKLSGTSVMSTDLRASVSLIMAAMVAEETSEVLRVYHLDRGYEQLENKFNKVGGNITRSDDQNG